MSRRTLGRLTTTIGLCWLGVSGCGDTGSTTSPPSRTDPAVQQARGQALERRQLHRAPAERPAAIAGEVPDNVMARIRGHLSRRTGVAEGALEVVRAEVREWPNGAMGCPQPGMHYTQALVPGYWIVLRHDGRDYDYRVARAGHFVICESMSFEQPPTS
jgi:hypothetical protein